MSSFQSSDMPASKMPANERAQKHPNVAAGEATAWKGGSWARLCWVLFGGMLAWLVVQTFHPVFWTTKGMDEVGFLPVDVQWRLDRNNAMLVAALLGGLTGAGLAVGEGLSRRSWKTARAAGVACGYVAALFGALAGYLGHRLFEFCKSNAQIADLNEAILVQGVLMTILGCGVGLGAGLSLGHSIRTTIHCVIGGLVSGVVASITYPLIVGLLMPGAMTTVLIPLEVGERLLWFGLFAGLAGVIIPSVAASSIDAEAPKSVRQCG